MLTIFTIPKGFSGPFEAIRLRALESWKLLIPRPDIVMFGDDPSLPEVAARTGVRHEWLNKHNEFGTPLLDDVFARAKALAAHDIMCFVNADIVLLDDFVDAVQTVANRKRPFLMVGQRRTVDAEGIEIGPDAWRDRLRGAAERTEPDGVYYIDYFVFTKGVFDDIPPFAVGRAAYDNWMVWKALRKTGFVVDATESVCAIHQRHDYSHIAGGREWAYEGAEANENRRLAKGRIYSIGDSSHALVDGRILRAEGTKYAAARAARVRERLRSNRVIRATKPLRHAVGLRWSTWDRLRRR